MDKKCENCNTNKATLLCHACNATLCSECDATIHKFGVFSRHERQSLEGCVVAGQCSIHHSRIVAICDTCKEACCCECLIGKHAGHTFTEYLNAFKRRRDEFEHLAQNLKTSCDIGRLISEAAQNEISQLDASKAKTIDEINASFAHVEEYLGARKAKLIEEVTETAAKRARQLQDIRASIDEQVSVADKLNTGVISDDSVAQGVEMEKALMVINEKVSTFVNKETSQVESFVYTDKKIDKAMFPSTREVETALTDVDFDKISQSFGVLTISPKYSSVNSLSIASVYDEVIKANRPDIDKTSVALTWGDNAPASIKAAIAKCSNVLFILERKDGGTKSPADFTKVLSTKETSARAEGLENAKQYTFRVRACIVGSAAADDVIFELWSTSPLTVVGGGFPGVWKEGPYYKLNEARTVATKDSTKGSFYGLALGTVPILTSGVTKWRFVVTKYCGSTACVGVAPIDADQTMHNPYESCGYYICTCDCELHAGPPYGYSHRDYVSGKVSTGGYIDVIVNMDERTISFTCNGKVGGVAYRDIPIDKPLVPAAAFDEATDAFELVACPEE